MKAHLNTHLLVPRSRSSAKVKVKYQGHVSQKMGVLGALVFYKHILFCIMIGVFTEYRLKYSKERKGRCFKKPKGIYDNTIERARGQIRTFTEREIRI